MQQRADNAAAAAPARCGTPLAGHDLMMLRGGMRAAALGSGPDGHRFLVEEQVRDGQRDVG